MKCYNCGAKLEKVITDLPFKLQQDSIVIFKKLPVLQCSNCREYLLEDHVLETIDRRLNKMRKNVELEILSYAV
jgi:YgiT-type zinc finger domain-containing protein